MKIEELLENLHKKAKGIADDSRKIKKGFVFVAINGLTIDSHKFIPDVDEKGAAFIIGEKNPSEFNLKNAIYIQVKDSREALGLLASAWFGEPSQKMTVIGVTGTDGKTTTSNIIYWILKTADKKVGLISTVSAKIENKEYDTGFHVTNPEPLQLQEFLNTMVQNDCQYAVLEVTSHGLAQQRVAGTKFDIGVLTNITHEHLDYHKTFENYVDAKAKLFTSVNLSILNKNDKSFDLIKNKLTEETKIIGYDFDNLDKVLKTAVQNRFAEKYNWQNSTAAISVAKYLGVSDKVIVEAFKTFPGVEGRMQEIKNKLGIKIIVDFAHTPNALENVLAVTKSQIGQNNKLIAVFGCAGERDIQKRPMMGEISTRLADISIFTAEDPRYENVSEIIKQMIEGISSSSKPHLSFSVPDRKEAIVFALAKANRGDTVVICGKGHEKSMNFQGVEKHWSDQEVVRELLNEK